MTDNERILKSFDVNFWVGRWKENKTHWHKPDVNPLLIKNIGLLTGGQKNLKIFVPLCGKTLDLKWLFDQGHRVVGVEACRLAVEDFFKEHSMEHTVEMRSGIPVFLVIIQSFHKDKTAIWTNEGSFDAIWDRGSLAAVNPEDRIRYLDLLSSLKTANCRHLIELYEYDDNLYQGERYDIKLIETEEAPEFPKQYEIEFKSFKRNLFLVTLKH